MRSERWILLPGWLVLGLYASATWLPAGSMLARSGSPSPGQVLGWGSGARLLAASVILAAASTVTAVLLGRWLAIRLTLTRMSARRLIWTILLGVFVTPPYLIAIGYVFGLGREGLLGRAQAFLTGGRVLIGGVGLPSAVLVLAAIWLPLAAFLTSAGLRAAPRAPVDNALLLLPAREVIRRIAGPVCRAEAVLAGGLIFVLTVQDFIVPNVTSAPVLAREVYLLTANYLSPEGALTAGLPMVLLSAIALAIAARGAHPRQVADLIPRRAPLARISSRRSLDFVAAAGVVSVMSLAPLWTLFREVSSFETLYASWRASAGDLLRTAGYAVGAAGVSAMAALAMLPLLTGPRWSRRITLLVLLGAWCLPPAVLSTSQVTLLAQLHLGDGPVLGTARLIATMAARYTPVMAVILLAAATRASRGPGELAAICGLGLTARLRHVFWPAVRDHLWLGCGLCLLFGLRELELALLSLPPGGSTMALRIFNSLHFRPKAETAALCTVLEIAVLLTALAWWRPRDSRGRE